MLYYVPSWVGGGDASYEELFSRAYKSMYGPFDDIFEIEALKRERLLDAKWLPNDGRSHLCHGFNFFHPQTMLNAVKHGLDWDGYEEANWTTLKDLAGDWVMYSPGPDLVAESPAWLYSPADGKEETGQPNYNERMLFHEYDPTNGTISYGNMFRTQRNPAGLGTHPHFYE